jgi:hypothetical protein
MAMEEQAALPSVDKGERRAAGMEALTNVRVVLSAISVWLVYIAIRRHKWAARGAPGSPPCTL